MRVCEIHMQTHRQSVVKPPMLLLPCVTLSCHWLSWKTGRVPRKKWIKSFVLKKRTSSFHGREAVPSSLLIFQALVFLSEELCSLFPLLQGCFPSQSLPVRWGVGAEPGWERKHLASTQGLLFFAMFAPWHFSQPLPVLLPTFIKNNPALESHCDTDCWE